MADGRDPVARRTLLSRGLTATMWAALLASYGTFAGFAVRFLFPRRGKGSWLLVKEARGFGEGAAFSYQTPAGAKVTVARQKPGDDAEAFIALSSVCPHLGCQVHWEPQNDRFFCPCHNGVFTPAGAGIGGPPGDAKQDLPRYPLKVERGLLFIQVPMETGLASRLIPLDAPLAEGPGHDPCLAARPSGSTSRSA